MKAKELRQKTKDELNRILQDSRVKLRELRFKLTLNKLKNVREIREIKKNIAKILTILKETKGKK
ncbi:MAG: 50S ribosomal protein L29 [Candidatus Staskawiczbacteria bacterium CG10_big_fil_rev_8_21_14_0_10_38_10]|uniref:Large ribosomal subunit protein uL29 n=1 Tax=Candidatus Staskawiczbacteria bacterium CG10_big_fil_rev_8_21_14_0_10_38_10 TaxID=1974891 RepID=A0A2H9T210_9BACT|nr:MAG: 50S ribosomal protein L29 [Candidatus Staskawiczbacteria bacterium CG10_big_fil_rev_8_21_14_0_10_38_10]